MSIFWYRHFYGFSLAVEIASTIFSIFFLGLFVKGFAVIACSWLVVIFIIRLEKAKEVKPTLSNQK